MHLLPLKPFEELEDFFDENKWLTPLRNKLMIGKPMMDIYETDKEVIMEVNVPGVDPKNIEVSLKDGILRIAGKGEKKEEERKKDYWRKEIYKGSFERLIRLPANIKESKAEAVYQKGVLKITVPKESKKAIKEKERKIKVKTK